MTAQELGLQGRPRRLAAPPCGVEVLQSGRRMGLEGLSAIKLNLLQALRFTVTSRALSARLFGGVGDLIEDRVRILLGG